MPADLETLISRPISEIAGALRQAIEDEDDARLTGLLRDLSQSTAAALAGDLAVITRHRSRLNRVRRSATNDLRGLPLAEQTAGALSEADRALDLARTRQVGRLQSIRQAERCLGVREKVFALLETPHRPRQIADVLGCDPSEASRALSELRRRGLVVQVPAPTPADADGRAHWFMKAARAE